MLQDRKDYRKSFNAIGQLHIGGEILTFNCYNLSVKGAMIEVNPGKLLTTLADFQTLIAEDNLAEIFVEELMLAGLVSIVWVREKRDNLLMGIHFENVVHNAEKFWLKRGGYRKTMPFNAELFLNNAWIAVEGVNRSTLGMCVKLSRPHPPLRVNLPIKLQIKELGMAALGKVVWIQETKVNTLVGLQLMTIN